MVVAKSRYDPEFQISGEQAEELNGSWAVYRDVIENADGVPFQLIFGRQREEGFFFNKGCRFQQLLGILPEDLTEKIFRGMIEEIVPLSEGIPADRAEAYRKLISGEISRYRAEMLIAMPGGEKKWIREASLPLVEKETGKVIGIYGIFYDISEERQNTDALNKIREIADESDRLKVAFLNNISHEIRTPLNAIVGFSTLLSEQFNNFGRFKDYLDVIFQNSDQLLEIIDNIVEISKIESKSVRISRETVDLGLIFQIVYDQFREKASEKGILLNFNAASDSRGAVVVTDRYKLTKVLRNLVGNALKFTSEGRVEWGYYMKDDHISFYVADTGIGIPEERQPDVFIRFYQGDDTAKRSYGGTGLGLAISKAYIELMGGKIWFTSRPGEGSIFRFTIPAERRDSD